MSFWLIFCLRYLATRKYPAHIKLCLEAGTRSLFTFICRHTPKYIQLSIDRCCIDREPLIILDIWMDVFCTLVWTSLCEEFVQIVSLEIFMAVKWLLILFIVLLFCLLCFYLYFCFVFVHLSIFRLNNRCSVVFSF